MVNKDQVKGVAKQVKGSSSRLPARLRQRRTEAEGTAEKAAGKVQKSYGDVKENIKKSL